MGAASKIFQGLYDDEIFNQESREWTRKSIISKKKQVPSDQEAYKKYKKMQSM